MPKKYDADALPRDKLLVLYQRLTLGNDRLFLGDLARDLTCSPQTVTRLVGVIERHLGRDTFIESGLEGRRRYYRIRAKTPDRTLGFSFEELHYLMICRDIAARFLPQSVAERIDRTLTTLALHLSEDTCRPTLEHGLGFRNKGFIDYAPHLEMISELRGAIEKKSVCEVIYKPSGRREIRTYRYAPGRILAMNGTLYVQGYRLAEGSLLKDRATTFSVHRIEKVTRTGEYFGFDAADTEARHFGLNWHPSKRIRVHVAASAADYVRDRIWSEDQTISEQDDGSLILEVSTTSEKELQAWVWSFGELAQIIDEQPHTSGEYDG